MLVDCVGVSSAIDDVVEPMVRLRERIVTVDGIWPIPKIDDLGDARGGV